MSTTLDVEIIWKMTQEEYEDGCDKYEGICMCCGETREDGVEPDARGYHCESCGENAVIGLEQALLEGKIQIVEKHAI